MTKEKNDYSPLYIVGAVLVIAIFAIVFTFNTSSTVVDKNVDTLSGQAIKRNVALAPQVQSNDDLDIDSLIVDDSVCLSRYSQAGCSIRTVDSQVTVNRPLVITGNAATVEVQDGVDFNLLSGSNLNLLSNSFFVSDAETTFNDQVFFNDEVRFNNDQVFIDSNVDFKLRDAYHGSSNESYYACFSPDGVLFASEFPCNSN